MASRGRHPFGRRKPKPENRVHLWKGIGGEWVPTRLGGTRKLAGGKDEVFLPSRPFVELCRVPDLSTANRIVRKMTGGRVKLARPGWPGAHWDGQSGSWFMITEDK